MKTGKFNSAIRPAIIHFLISCVVAITAAALVFGVWFPGAYRDMAGGTELFALLICVDIVCGPILTFVLFNPGKKKRELWIDIGLVIVIQVTALIYGLWTVWQVRPLYLPHEFDRFKVVSLIDLRGASTDHLLLQLQPSFFTGPKQVALREPKDVEEKSKILFEALNGGADYGERPDFYRPFDDAAALKTLDRAKLVKDFLIRYPHQQSRISDLARKLNQPLDKMKYLPISARHDWIAVLTPTGQIADFVSGDGF
jgi:hypothetical protein